MSASDIPPAPGRDSTAAPASATETQPASAPSGTPVGAQQGPFGGSLFSILIILVPVLMLFFMTRNQTKKQKQIESSLKAGDRVITQSGLIGKLVEVVDTRVKLEIAPGVSVLMLKSAVAGVDAGDKPTDPKASEKK